MTDDLSAPEETTRGLRTPTPAVAPDPDLAGADYRARVRLSTADDVTVADAGETCERVAVQSLRPLLAAGMIEPVTTPPTPALPPVEPLPRRRSADRGDH